MALDLSAVETTEPLISSMMAVAGAEQGGMPRKYREVDLLSSSLSATVEKDLNDFLSGDTLAVKNLVDLNLLLFEKIAVLEASAKTTFVSQQKMQDRASLLERDDDVSEVTRRHRKNARDVATLARINGVGNIKTHSDGLVIEDTKYRFSDFDLLPASLKLFKAKSRDDGEDVFFQGEHSPLSNFFPSRFIDSTGMILEKAEQAFQFRKANAHGSLSLASKIIATRNPYKAKQLGKKVQVDREWKHQENDVMSDILLAKFTQNKNIGNYLIDLAGRQLHEAKTDRKWAVGTDLSSKALVTEDWKGNDVLGQLLEATRDSLMATLDGESLPPTQSVHSKSDTQDDQYHPMSDDELSDNYEECVQSEDEIPASEGSVPPNLDTSVHSSTEQNHLTEDSGQHTSRNPYRKARQKADITSTGSPSESHPQVSQANISTRTQRTRKKKKRQSKEQLSQTNLKQAF